MCDTHNHTEEKKTDYASFDTAAEFHGHICPGLSSGYRVAIAAMNALGVSRPKDEELVAIAETNACGVDAIQFITGCTAGKGNLIIHDYGKHAFTFYCRKSNKAVRVVTCLEGFMPEGMNSLRPKVFSGHATEEEKARYQELAHRVSMQYLQHQKRKF
jgi:formylmethanofuran dehydrogenase subunit E